VAETISAVLAETVSPMQDNMHLPFVGCFTWLKVNGMLRTLSGNRF
jgi:hypothetical protein